MELKTEAPCAELNIGSSTPREIDDLLRHLDAELTAALGDNEPRRPGFVRMVMRLIKGTQLTSEPRVDECIAIRVQPDPPEPFELCQVESEVGGEKVYAQDGGVVLRMSLLASEDWTMHEMRMGVRELMDERGLNYGND